MSIEVSTVRPAVINEEKYRFDSFGDGKGAYTAPFILTKAEYCIKMTSSHLRKCR